MDQTNQPPRRGSLDDRQIKCEMEIGAAARESTLENDLKGYIKVFSDELTKQRHTVADKWIDTDGNKFTFLSFHHGIPCYIQIDYFSEQGYDKLEALKKAQSSTKNPDILCFAISLSEYTDPFQDTGHGKIKVIEPFSKSHLNDSEEDDYILDEDNPF
jgi:hypothetical protein